MTEVAIYFNYPLFSPVMNFEVLKTGKSSGTALYLKISIISNTAFLKNAAVFILLLYSATSL
jgi:hypothetical protein